MKQLRYVARAGFIVSALAFIVVSIRGDDPRRLVDLLLALYVLDHFAWRRNA